MKRISLYKQKGMVSGLMAVALLLLAISLPVTVLLVQKNQENRSKAAEEIGVDIEEEDLIESMMEVNCGSADGQSYAVRPTADLCENGDVAWRDSSGSEGNYLWSCLGNDEDNSVDCSAEKLLKEEGGSLDGRCGESNGTDQNSKPISNYVLCKAGELVWTDEVANDGDFNWTCKGLNGGGSVDCLAFKPGE